MTYRIGLSTCPNDTYLFHALLSGEVRDPDVPLEFVLADVQELNAELERGSLHYSKASFATALALSSRYLVLPVGAALGRGVGPVVVGARPGPVTDSMRVVAPGAGTTAFQLWQRYFPGATQVGHRIFSDIMPAIQRGEADIGVVIHEGRFTYGQYGLHLIDDLGRRWEEEQGVPLPLGGILGQRELPEALHRRVTALLAASLRFARNNPQQAIISMRQHAAEFSDAVLWQHVELYVNKYTADLEEVGRDALQRFSRCFAAEGEGFEILAVD